MQKPNLEMANRYIIKEHHIVAAKLTLLPTMFIPYVTEKKMLVIKLFKGTSFRTAFFIDTIFLIIVESDGKQIFTEQQSLL